MKFRLPHVVMLFALFDASVAAAQTAQTKATLSANINSTIFPNTNYAITPQAVNALAQTILTSMCGVAQAADCPLPPGVFGTGFGSVIVTGSPYNADPTGVNDSTLAFIQAVNSGSTSVIVPAGTFNVCGVTMPSTPLLTVWGLGPASKIVQGACGSPAFQWVQSSNVYSEQHIRGLSFDSTVGTNHTINTTGAGGLTLNDLYFNSTPAGFDNIYVNGAGGAAVHDIDVHDIQVYDTGPSGKAFVEFGPLAVDSDIRHVVGNGNFLTNYGILLASGVTTVRLYDNHPYNVKLGSLYANGCLNCQSIGNTWDNVSAGDVVTLNGVANSAFVDQIEAINTGKNGITLNNSSGNNFTGTVFGTFNNQVANFAVNETGTSDYNVFQNGSLSNLNSYTLPIFSFLGAHSYAKGFGGFTNLGEIGTLSGVTASAQAASTTQFLGANGGQATAFATAWNIKDPGWIRSATFATNVSLGAVGTFTLLQNGGSIGSCTSSTFGCTITLSPPVQMSAGDTLYGQSAFAGGAASAYVRYNIQTQW